MRKTAPHLMLLLMSTMSLNVQADLVAHEYMLKAIANYSNTHSQCEDLKEEAPEVYEEVLQALASYPPQEAELYLMGRSHQMIDECVHPELAELAIALQTLEDADIDERTRESMAAIHELVFSPIRWEFEKRYRQLPQTMRHDLNSYPVFQQPFESLPIREKLEQR